jgi:hypothetical protein
MIERRRGVQRRLYHRAPGFAFSEVTAMQQSDYVFANSADEQYRLERQAGFPNPLTERVLQAAGLMLGMRVLDLGSKRATLQCWSLGWLDATVR